MVEPTSNSTICRSWSSYSARFHASLLDSEADRQRFDAFRRAGKHVIAFWDFEVWHNPVFVVGATRHAREMSGCEGPPDDR
ncbi:MAG TPA: hypothetical protein VJ815_10770 [Acidimicrobiia bacterium]|nr:hypothetical protein [Acidimicrobiia bacterium]